MSIKTLVILSLFALGASASAVTFVSPARPVFVAPRPAYVAPRPALPPARPPSPPAKAPAHAEPAPMKPAVPTSTTPAYPWYLFWMPHGSSAKCDPKKDKDCKQ